MLKCRDVLEQADAYLDQQLSGWQRLQFKLHLLLCRNCRRYIKNLQLTQQVSQQVRLSQTVPSETELDSLMRLIEQDKVQR
jgi:hypothetical protein